MPGRSEPPLVTRVELALTMRDPEGAETPVIVVTLVDDQGGTHTVHMTEHTGMEFGPDLLVAVRQLHHGHMKMPYS